ncbi:MAG: shikimate dehydrogenase [Proteobacteria bacterium]|nr:shikimate dehydrogenase [Pseudomonadota bacterium]
MTDRYAVIGHPIAHSKSPSIHAGFARQTGQDMSYEKILAPLDGFAPTVQAFVAAGGRGMNVTVPFKQEAVRFATRLSERARLAGAVNTLVFDGSDIYGDNTDGIGLVRDLRDNLGRIIAGQRILLLGAGGAARGVIQTLLNEHPRQLAIANRTAGKAQDLASEYAGFTPQAHGCGLADLAGRSFDIVINATSAGLTDSALDLPAGIFAANSLAYEMLYGRETPFMRQARSAGAAVADGLGMLVEQAAEAFLLWRGICPDTAPVLKELRAELQHSGAL